MLGISPVACRASMGIAMEQAQDIGTLPLSCVGSSYWCMTLTVRIFLPVQ